MELELQNTSDCPLDGGRPAVIVDPDPQDWDFETASLVDSFDSATSASGKLGGVTGVLAGGAYV